ncbi:ATP-binding protein [Streptomyces sp. URMC 126]|uniref:ATP-binding protein n=1 Tax=Streptomyces sp. URMC 126 TaxID=3423401 RepID=UPI003F1D8056
MDPTNRTPDAARPGEGRAGTDSPVSPASPASPAEDAGQGPAPVRVVQLVAGDYLLTVNPVDGSEIEPCPPGRLPAEPRRHDPEARADRDRAALPPPPAGAARSGAPLIGRGEVRERLGRLLSRGRSVRLTGPAGSGRTTLLDVVAADCAHLAPDGVVRLNGRHRTTADLLHELFAAVHHAPSYRPDRAGLPAAVREIGAVVVLDDLEFGGAALDELLDATPECAFLFAARPDVPAPSADAHVEEVALDGLDRTEALELLETAVDRPLTDEEADWAADLWVESDGLPLRFVQAGALLRRLDAAASEAGTGDDERPFSIPEDAGSAGAPAARREPLPRGTAPAVALAARLGDSARETLRFALALGGEVPHQAQLPALVGDTHADAAVGELVDGGLVTAVGAHYRVAAGVAEQLAGASGTSGADWSEGAAERVLAAARHYAWWAGHPSVTPERIAAEADVVLAALAALVTSGAPGHPAAAVLLARTAAPAFAGALHWSAWERGLRHGQEAARLAGEVGEEAYFHHELGVLALCTGNLGRARAELEASTGLRGVLADKRGAVASRRALALVADRSRPAPAPAPVRPGVPPFPAPAGGPRGSAGEEVPAARSEQSAAPPAGPAPFTTDPDRVSTAAIKRVPAPRAGAGAGAGAGKAPAGASGKRPGGPQAWAQKLMAGGGRRNLAAAGAGVVLAAVLGTVVSLGTSAGSGEQGGGDQDAVKPDRSASQQDGEPDLTADHPVPGGGGPAPMRGRPTGGPERPGTPGPTGAPSGTPSGSSSPSPSGSASPGDSPSPTRTPGGGRPTETRTPGGGETTKPQPPTTPTEPTAPPKTDPPPVTQPPATPPAGGGDPPGSGTVKPGG